MGDRQERLAEILVPYPWDYLLGSVHWVDGQAVDQRPGMWEDLSVEEVWRRYVDALCELTRSGAVDVLAHPDVVKIFGQRPGEDELAELHGRIAAAAAEAGVSLEISTAGLRKPVAELYPDPALLFAAAAAGVPVTLASDAHEPSFVGVNFDAALELARSAGIETVTVFEGRSGRQEPLS